MSRYYVLLKRIAPSLGCGLLGYADNGFVDVCDKFKVCLTLICYFDYSGIVPLEITSYDITLQALTLEFVKSMFSRDNGRFASREHLGLCILEDVKTAIARANALID